MPGDATKLIAKYCAPAGQQGSSPGETAPLQNTPAEMENYRTEAFIDGVAYFNAIQEEIQSLKKPTAKNPFFYMAAWWLGLSSFEGKLRVADSWNFENLTKKNGERCARF